MNFTYKAFIIKSFYPKDQMSVLNLTLLMPDKTYILLKKEVNLHTSFTNT